MQYQPVIGLEVHAELQTRSKMFCACPVVDSTLAEPNTAVCPVCAGMPGMLPVLNRQAVEYGLRVALALDCSIAHTSLFARKNYFYPDLPKGYQISQYEYPLALNGHLTIDTEAGERTIRIRRVHLEEDTGKLTHVHKESNDFSLVDLNRAGVPLLEMVSEPDLHSLEEVRAYALAIRAILRTLGVNSGDMEKGVIRFEANVSLRPVGVEELGTRVEIKNLNSFRAMERAIQFQLDHQAAILNAGGRVSQETLGWDEATGTTYSQRSKEEAHDYRYFPEPDLPPLVVEADWIERVAADQPELPRQKKQRFINQFALSEYDARLLVEDQGVAAFFEQTVAAAPELPAKLVANWMLGEVFGWMRQSGTSLSDLKLTPAALSGLVQAVHTGRINQATGKAVLAEMLQTGSRADEIIRERGLEQISDDQVVAELVSKVLSDHPQELATYLTGKEPLANWFFGQIMKAGGKQVNPGLVRAELERQLARHKQEHN
jgi:aspartyl-tRNA(Asn)/glutamyl-tRNA(Gln) amidotransferase subunit B